MPLSDEFVDMLVCPSCRTGLAQQGEGLVCAACKVTYPVRDDIPILLVEEARPLTQGARDTLSKSES